MAVIAASIAARIAYFQFQHNKDTDIDKRWWDTLTWVYDRTVTEKDKKPPLPQKVTFTMLKALADEPAEARYAGLRKKTIRSILSMFESSTDKQVREDEKASSQTPSLASEDQGGASDPILVNDPDAEALLEHLRQTVSIKGAATSFTSGLEFETSVESALYRVTKASPGVSISKPTPSMDTGFDYEIRASDVLLLVQVGFTKQAALYPSMIAQWTHELKRSNLFPEGTPGGALIVTNKQISKKGELMLAQLGEGRVQHVVWRGEDDDASLASALRRSGIPVFK